MVKEVGMSRGKILAGVLAIIVGLVVTGFAYSNASRLVVTAEVVVPKEDIEPSTLITGEMLATKQVPRTLLEEGIYRSVEELAGRVSVTTLRRGRPVFHDQAVPPAQFRLASDPSLEVVSVTVEPEKACGGRIRAGNLICIYRVAIGRPAEGDPEALLASRGASVEKVVCTLALDVRASKGLPLVERKATPSAAAFGMPSVSQERPMSIITVGVPPEVALDLLRLMGEKATGRYDIMVTLGPLH